MKRFYPMDEAVAARADLSMASKGIHAVLSSFARMESGAFPSQETIGAALAISGRHVRNGLRQLEAAGLLERRRRGVLQSNSYQLVTSECADVRNSSSVRNVSSGNSSSSPVRNICSDHCGTSVPPNRAKNRLIEASDSDDATEDRLKWFQDSLETFSESLGRPDLNITRKIDAATHGASLDVVGETLGRLFDSGLPQRMRSWALLAKVLDDEFRGAA